MGSANFWDNQETAQQTVAELKRLGVSIDPVEAAAELCNEQRANIELGDEFGVDEVRDELARVNDKLRNCLDTLELQVMLGGAHDSRNAYITLQSGAGGVEGATTGVESAAAASDWGGASGATADGATIISGSWMVSSMGISTSSVSRAIRWFCPSMIAEAILFVISLIDRIASSLPGIG